MLPVIYHPDNSPPFPAGHRFPMAKFSHLHAQLQASPAAAQLRVTAPACIAPADVLRVHCPHYLDDFRQGRLSAADIKRSGLPWSPDLVQRTLRECGGTLATARLALAEGLACHLAGGTHHARRDHGAGFCLLNDLAITATTLRQHGEAQRILILDCDVHQGDGSAELLAQTEGVWTVSLHAARNYPARKAVSH